MSKGWWHRATTEQRLAQIDAAIQLKMTAGQVAKNCGCYDAQDYANFPGKVVASFAASHGRYFNSKRPWSLNIGHVGGKPVAKRTIAIEHARSAYLSGEVVDFWGAR